MKPADIITRLLGTEPELSLDDTEIPPPDEIDADEPPLHEEGDDASIAYEADHAPPPPWQAQ